MGRVASASGRRGEKHPDGKKVAAVMSNPVVGCPGEVAKGWKVAIRPLWAGLVIPNTWELDQGRKGRAGLDPRSELGQQSRQGAPTCPFSS